MKPLKIMLTIVFLASICTPQTAFAASYQPFQIRHHYVYLFHSGTDEITGAIHVGDILTVYRTSHSSELKEVGKIKVISHMREIYLRGEVMEGEIKPNDIAKEGKISFLIISDVPFSN